MRRLAVAALPPGWRAHPDGTPTVRFMLHADGRVTCDGSVADGPDAGPTGTLARELRHHIALHAPSHIFIHAAVAAVGEAAIIMPGRALSGKTTLVASLVDAGALYYSDEYAVVDGVGMVHPFAKPLSVRKPGRPSGVPVTVPSDRTGTVPLRAGLIVLTAHQHGIRWRPRALTASAGALALLDNAVAARTRPAEVLAAAAQLAAGARILSGARGEAREVAAEILDVAAQTEGSPAAS